MLHIREEAFHFRRKDWRSWREMQQKMEGLTGNVSTNKKKKFPVVSCSFPFPSLTPQRSSLSSILSLRKEKKKNVFGKKIIEKQILKQMCRTCSSNLKPVSSKFQILYRPHSLFSSILSSRKKICRSQNYLLFLSNTSINFERNQVQENLCICFN